MTNRHSALILPLVLIGLSAVTPSASGDDLNGEIFVGHFGEVIPLPDFWTAEPVMRAETEVVYFHQKLGAPTYLPDGSRDIIQKIPKHSDYKPENFTPLGLLELVVVPKNAPGAFRNLSDLRRAKIKELVSIGADYTLNNNCGYRQHFDFPEGSFQIAIRRPYYLFQCYSYSPKDIYILTSAFPPMSDPTRPGILRCFDFIARALEKHVTDLAPPDEYLEFINKYSAYMVMWLVVNVPLLFFWVLPPHGSILKRLNFIGFTVFLFYNVFGLSGFFVICALFHATARTASHGHITPVLFALIGPWISRWAARRFYNNNGVRIFRWSWLPALALPAIFFSDLPREIPPSWEFTLTATFLTATVGAAFGLIFSLIIHPRIGRTA